MKAPLFDFTLGRALPPSGSANADDLQDLLGLYLDQCKAAGGEVYAFGAKFDSNLHKPIDIDFGNTDGLHGVHDIHMNQGNVGAHAGDNGTFHDGGLLLAFPDRLVGLFLAFQTQRVPTDAVGDASPGRNAPVAAHRRPSRSGHRQRPGTAYLERALINPVGADPGHEAVVLGQLRRPPPRRCTGGGSSTATAGKPSWMWCWPAARRPWSRWTAPGSSSGTTAATWCCSTIAASRWTASPMRPSEASVVDRFVRFRR